MRYFLHRIFQGDQCRQTATATGAPIMGIIGALSAVVYLDAARFAEAFPRFPRWLQAPGVPSDGRAAHQIIVPHRLRLIPAVCAPGGLISGALVYGLAPETKDRGADTVVKALHFTCGTLRARVAPVKMITSAVTIGSGVSASREGPAALIAAGFGSIYATWFKRTERDRQVIVMKSMAARLSAIFRSPIGGAIFRVEGLYSSMELERAVSTEKIPLHCRLCKEA